MVPTLNNEFYKSKLGVNIDYQLLNKVKQAKELLTPKENIEKIDKVYKKIHWWKLILP